MDKDDSVTYLKSGSCASQFADTANAQLQAPFFSKLHGDARHLVYRELLGYDDHALCFGTQLKHGTEQHVQIWRGLPLLDTRDYKAKKYDTITGSATVCDNRKANLMPLLLVCRRL